MVATAGGSIEIEIVEVSNKMKSFVRYLEVIHVGNSLIAIGTTGGGCG